MPAPKKTEEVHYSVEEYLSMERLEPSAKNEFVDGTIYGMGGASFAHVRITSNLQSELHARLKGSPCQALSVDLKVCTDDRSFFAYPDVVIVCGEPRFHDDKRDVLLNPSVIIEVLSPSTERYDRVKKTYRYRQMLSLREYVLVAQDVPRLEQYRREAVEWTSEVVVGLDDELVLESIGTKLPLSEIYAGALG